MPHQNYKNWPSATTLTSVLDKPDLDNWRARVGYKKAKQIAEGAASLGREVHKLIERQLKNKQVRSKDKKAKELVKALFKRYPKLVQRDWVEIEKHVHHNGLKMHGTCDSIFRGDDGRLNVVDWKTSGQLGKEVPLQLTIYAMCYEDMTGITIDTGLAVRIDKKTHKVETKVYHNLKQYRPLVEALRILYRYLYDK